MDPVTTPVAEPETPRAAAPAVGAAAPDVPSTAKSSEARPAPKPLVRPAEQGFPLPFVTRKTPVVLLLRIVGATFLLEAAYIFARAVLPPAPLVDSIWTFVIVAGAQLAVAAVLFFDWFTETYEVHKEDIHHNRGILFRHEETYPYNNMQSITCNQSPLGRIFHYGEVKVFVPTLGEDLSFAQVPHPHHFIATVRHIMPYPDQHRFILHG
ncbi:MAG: PH domain-containing protein [bacterium]|nr:PH domain-containing protein [bacterium]MDZ4247887.1 PH domain-containing protein [Patescibacteria group bacterium]